MRSPKHKTSHTQGILLLIIITLIWGTTFPLLKNVVNSLSPSVLIAFRFTVATVAFIPFIHRLNLHQVCKGVILGVLLFITFATQAIGIETIPANRAAFITSLNTIIVPLLGLRLSRMVLLAAGLAVVGIGLMSWETGAFRIGDLWMFGCAISYATYILILEQTASKSSPLSLTAIQLLIVAILSTIWATPEFIEEIEIIKKNFGALMYLGLMASAISTWLQVIAQRRVSAHETALIFTLEPVFATVFSFLLLGEKLGTRGIAGSTLIIVAIIINLSQRKI